MPAIDLGLNITVLNNASGGLKNVANGVKEIGENAQQAHNRLKAIQVVIAGIVVGKILEYSRAFVEAATKNEAARVRLVAFTGSLQAAGVVSEALSSKFRSTGFDVDELMGSFVRLRSAVKDNEQGLLLISTIANDVAALGGNNRNVDNLAEAFQRLGGRGVASMRDMNAILINTPITLRDMAKAAGETSTQFEGNLRNGFMHGAQLIDAFIKASKDKVGDYAQYLKGTLAGGIGDIKNSLEESIGGLGTRTNVNVQLAATFHNIAEAVRDFVASIDQSKIDAFFKWARDMEPFLAKLVVSVFNIGTAVVGVVSMIVELLGNMPQEALEMGMLGYIILGKRGFMIMALMSELAGGIQNVGNNVDQFMIDHDLAKDFFTKDLEKNKKTFMQAVTDATQGHISSAENPFKGFKSIIPTAADIAKMQAALQGLNTKTFTPGGNGGEESYAEQQARLVAEALKTKIQAALDTINDSLDHLHFKNMGDELGAALSDINKNADHFVGQLKVQLEEIKKLKAPMEGQADIIDRINETIARTNQERDIALVREKELYALKTQQFALDQAVLQLQLQQQAREVRLNASQGERFNALRGTPGGQLQETVQSSQVQMLGEVQQYSSKILALQEQMRDVEDNPERTIALQDTIDKYKALRAATSDALEHLSVEGELAKQQWKDIGASLHTDVADGLMGLIKGTTTFGQIMNKVWEDITQSVIQYLLKLAEAKAMQSVLGSGGESAGGTDFASAIGSGIGNFLGALANGGAFKGHITPFADGGLVQGPTLFGLAGEAGDEAIMPLSRIGGKLGVRSSGGGGNHYHITVQAIDTQTGMEFIAQHIDTIDQNLSHSKNLNRARSMR